MIPAELALALRADGWWLRAEIIWAKPNPMPESVTDRPTKAHEQVYLLAKSPRYFYDQDAIREAAAWERWGDQTNAKHEGSGSSASWIGSKSKRELQGGRQAREYDAEHFKTTEERNTRFQGPNPAGGRRNARSVWEIATEPYPDAHFATFPTELARRCIAAGTSERGVCGTCGAPWERVTDGASYYRERDLSRPEQKYAQVGGGHGGVGRGPKGNLGASIARTTGWQPTCGCASDPVASVVLDPFAGSGTVAHVARKLGRRSIGIELNAEYAELAARRTSQLGLLA